MHNRRREAHHLISLLTTNTSSDGGKEIESISSIKKYAPKIYSSYNRAVTASDYEAIVPKIYPETQSISVFGGEDLNPPQYGKVFIAIKPISGDFLANSVKENLKNLLISFSKTSKITDDLDNLIKKNLERASSFNKEDMRSQFTEKTLLLKELQEKYAIFLSKYEIGRAHV